MANEHIFNNSITVTGSVSSSVGFYGDGSGLSGITAVAEWDGTRDGNASITGSLIVSGSGVNVDFTNTTGVSGSFSGSFAGSATGTFAGDGTNLTGVTATIPAGVVSGSTQISYTGITDVPSGIVSSSAQFNNITSPFSGSFTGSYTGDGSGLTSLTLPPGVVSGSDQISYTGITDIPTNIVSSSAQFITLTSPFTGSFTGSFTGDGAGLTGVTATATGGIFQTGSNTGAIKTNDTSYTSIASGQYSFAGGGRYVTASADYSVAIGGLNTQASNTYAFAAGGSSTHAKGVGTVALGLSNTASGSYSAVIGGDNHEARGERSIIAGGRLNTVTGCYGGTFVGSENTVSNPGAVILGGSCQTTNRDNVVVVNNLFATGSGTADTATFTGVVQLANRTATPATGVEGMLMVSASVLYFYGESGWAAIS